MMLDNAEYFVGGIVRDVGSWVVGVMGGYDGDCWAQGA